MSLSSPLRFAAKLIESAVRDAGGDAVPTPVPFDDPAFLAYPISSTSRESVVLTLAVAPEGSACVYVTIDPEDLLTPWQLIEDSVAVFGTATPEDRQDLADLIVSCVSPDPRPAHTLAA